MRPFFQPKTPTPKLTRFLVSFQPLLVVRNHSQNISSLVLVPYINSKVNLSAFYKTSQRLLVVEQLSLLSSQRPALLPIEQLSLLTKKTKEYLNGILSEDLCNSIIKQLSWSRGISWKSDDESFNQSLWLCCVAEFMSSSQKKAFSKKIGQMARSKMSKSERSISPGKSEVLPKCPLYSFSWEIDKNDIINGEFLETGSFGQVRKGKYGNIDVVIKTATDAHNSEAFLLKEIAYLHTLKHPNIVEFVGASFGKELKIVTKYAENGNLSSFMKSNHPLSLQLIVKFAKNICSGIEYLHSQGIIHGDIKGANVLVTEDLVCKIIDFGISIDTAGEMSNHVGSGDCSPRAALGTLSYLAPEVLNGERPTTASDIYSLGLTLLELATGKAPYQGLTQMNVLRNIAERILPDIPSQLNYKLAEIIKSCLYDAPEKRITASAMLKSLKRLGKEIGQTAKPPKPLVHSTPSSPTTLKRVKMFKNRATSSHESLFSPRAKE